MPDRRQQSKEPPGSGIWNSGVPTIDPAVLSAEYWRAGYCIRFPGLCKIGSATAASRPAEPFPVVRRKPGKQAFAGLPDSIP